MKDRIGADNSFLGPKGIDYELDDDDFSDDVDESE